MSHKIPVNRDKRSHSSSVKDSTTREKKGSESQTSRKVPHTSQTRNEASTNMQKDSKERDKTLKKKPGTLSTQTPKTSRKPKNAAGYLTFRLSAPVTFKVLNGVRPSTLSTSYMPSPNGSQGSSDSTPTSGGQISNFLRIVAAGYANHLYVPVSIGEEDPYTTFLSADSGSAIITLNEAAIKEHIRKYPGTDLLKHPENMNVKLRFSSTGPIIGKLYKNTVTLDDTATAEDQQFAVAANPKLPKGGILGIGPTSQTKGKVEGQPNNEIPTVLDNLIKSKKLSASVLGINVFPWDETEENQQRLNAEYHFGGMDESAIIKSTLRTVPITQYFPSSEAYGVDVEITCGGSNGERVCILGIKEELATGIIDTGEQGILFPEKVVEEYMKAIDAEATPPQQGSELRYWSIPRKNLLKLQPFALHFNDMNNKEVTFRLPVEAQVFPPVVTDNFGLPKDRLYLTIKARPQARPGFRFVLGLSVLMRLYFAIDFSNGQKVMQIAKTKYTDMESPGLAEIRRELIKEDEERRKATRREKHPEGKCPGSSSNKAAGTLKGKERRK